MPRIFKAGTVWLAAFYSLLGVSVWAFLIPIAVGTAVNTLSTPFWEFLKC